MIVYNYLSFVATVPYTIASSWHLERACRWSPGRGGRSPIARELRLLAHVDALHDAFVIHMDVEALGAKVHGGHVIRPENTRAGRQRVPIDLLLSHTPSEHAHGDPSHPCHRRPYARARVALDDALADKRLILLFHACHTSHFSKQPSIMIPPPRTRKKIAPRTAAMRRWRCDRCAASAAAARRCRQPNH